MIDNNRRSFLGAIPALGFATIATTFNVGDGEVKAFEIKPGKRYAFVFDHDYVSREKMDEMKAVITKAGFGDVLLINGPIKIFELEKQPYAI